MENDTVKRMTMEEVTEKAVSLIKGIAEVLGENPAAVEMKTVAGNIEVAMQHADNDELKAFVYDAAVKVANNAAFAAYRANVLTGELEDTYRSLDSVETTTDKVNEFINARNARAEEIEKLNTALQIEGQRINAIRSIIDAKDEEARNRAIENLTVKE